MGVPLLQKTGEMCPVRQINVTAKFWNLNRVHMSDDEANTLYKCAVHRFHALHKWDGGGVPSQTMEL